MEEAAPHVDTPPIGPEASPQVMQRSAWKTVFIAGSVVVLAVLAIAGGVLFMRRSQSVVEQERVYHVGVLDALEYFAPGIDGFKQRMAELGYVEGKNITYDIQHGPQPVGNQAILKKFVDDRVDLIVAFPTEASLEAKEATKGTSIPIVSLDASFEDTDLVQSMQHPGGNLTGVRFPIPEIAAKRLEILHQIAPKAVRIWIPYLKDYPTVRPALEVIRPLAASLGLTIIEAPFTSPDEITAEFAAQAKDPEFDAVLYIPEPISILPPFADPIQAFADEHKIPVAGIILKEDDTGPVFSLIPDGTEVGRLAAPLADKIFKGASPGDLPIVTPEPVFEINYKSIQRLGLSVSEGLLSTASRVVH